MGFFKLNLLKMIIPTTLILLLLLFVIKFNYRYSVYEDNICRIEGLMEQNDTSYRIELNKIIKEMEERDSIKA